MISLRVLSNTLKIAERCEFNLVSDLGYTLPEPAVPSGYTADSYLQAPLFRGGASADMGV